jgi:ketosteroid isomerase-like protein
MQSISSVQVVVRGRWAFEIAEVESKLTPHSDGESTNAHSTTVIALNRQPDGSWKVGRVLGLVDSLSLVDSGLACARDA